MGLHDPILFPRAYAWFIGLASLDVLLTSILLAYGGEELNTIANWVIRNADLSGMTLYKFATVVVVLLLCEYIGRHELRAARRLSHAAVAINALPVTLALVHFSRIAQDPTILRHLQAV